MGQGEVAGSPLAYAGVVVVDAARGAPVLAY